MRRARAFVTFGVVMLLALAFSGTVVAGCGSTEKLYSDSTYGYTFSYPNTWKVQAGTSDVTAGGKAEGNTAVYDPTGTKVGTTYVDLAMIMIYDLDFTVDDPWSNDMTSRISGMLTSLENQTTGIKVEKPLEHATKAELKGYSVTFTFTKDAVPMRSTLYFLFDHTREYQVTEQAAVDTWDRAKPMLDEIVASFKPRLLKK